MTMSNQFEQFLEKEGALVYRTQGRSMRPMLHENRDLVVLIPLKGTPSKYDVVLYRRGEQYVLHRVIAPGEKYCLIRGDSTYNLEKVSNDNIFAVLESFVRNGRSFSADSLLYRLYVRIRCGTFPFRSIIHKLRRRAAAAARRAGLKK